MRYFGIMGLIIFSIHGQQPPTDSTIRTWTSTRTYTRMEHITLKNESIAVELQELRDKLKTSAHLAWSQTTAALYQRGNDIISDPRALEFSCIIDRENDATILSQLVAIQKHFEKMLDLEDKLEKQDIVLTHNTEKLLQGHDDAATHVEIIREQEELFNAMLQLMYQQTIRRFQKLSAIRGMLAQMPKP